jgi:uncharacterized protein
MRKLLPLFLTLLLAPAFTFAYTSPGNPIGWVNDFANMLTVSEKTSLEAELSAFTKETGAEIAVVTIPTLGNETVETYAVQLFKEWEIGQKGKDNGILLLVAKDEREVRIEVGYGMEPYVTDADSSRIIRNVFVPAFKDGEYSKGINDTVSSIEGLIRKDPEAISQRQEKSSFSMSGELIATIFFLIVNLIGVMARSKSWWLGGIIGAIIGGILFKAITAVVIGSVIGLIFDFLLSLLAGKLPKGPGGGPMFFGGGFGGRGGGGFGGFGGGMSGGGGSSGRW